MAKLENGFFTDIRSMSIESASDQGPDLQLGNWKGVLIVQDSMDSSSRTNSSEQQSPVAVGEESRPIHWRTYFSALSALMYVFVVGMDVTYSSPATEDIKRPGSRFRDITPEEITWIVAIQTPPGAVGSLVAGYISQKYGRKSLLMYMSIPFVFGWLLIAYAPTLACIYVGRFTVGFCFGLASIVVPAYVTEISPVRIRGLLNTGYQVGFTVGAFIMICLAYLLRWTGLALAGAAVMTAGACSAYFIPESPAWLLKEGRKIEAVQSLIFLRGKDANIDAELEVLHSSHGQVEEDSRKLEWKEIRDPRFYKPLAISITLFLVQQWSGSSVLLSYLNNIFESTGSSIDPQLCAVIFTAVNIVASVTGSFLMDRAGRRKLYIISASFSVLSLFTLGLYEYLHFQNVDLRNWDWLPLASSVVYIIFFSFGLAPMPMAMTPELVPIHSRSFMLSITVTFAALFAFSAAKSFVFLSDNIGFYGLFWLYTSFAFVGLIFGIFFLPETKGRTIEDINNSFLN